MGRKTLHERFHEKYEICPKTGCWLWTASTFRDGYGKFWVDGKYVGAHRYAYELHKGPILDGLYVLHRCDVSSCIRPDHLFLGTNQDNVDDRNEKDRQAKGSAHGQSRLTESQALEIYHAEGTQVEIAARYGVDPSLVSMIKNKQLWVHIHD